MILLFLFPLDTNDVRKIRKEVDLYKCRRKDVYDKYEHL